VTIVAESLATADAMLRERLGDRVRRDVALAPMTTYRVGGSAGLFLDARDVDDLAAVRDVRRATGVPVLVVGRGSNMLVADSGFEGLAISISAFADGISLPTVSARAAHPASSPRAARCPCRCWLGARQRPASPVSSGRSACPARSAAPSA